MSESFEQYVSPQPKEGGEEESQEVQHDIGNPEAQERGKQKLFIGSCEERLDELVRLKMLPEKFAQERRNAAHLVTEGFSDNPEEDGAQFAEIGTESIGLFQRGIDDAVANIEARVQPAIDSANDVLRDLEGNSRMEEAATLRESIEAIQLQLEEFRETATRVKNLELSFPELLKRSVEIEESL